MPMVFQIYLPELFSNSQQAINLAKTKKFGEFKQNKVTYTSYEAFYLIESKKANAYCLSTILSCRATKSSGPVT